MPARRQSPPGLNVKLPPLLHAECTLMAAGMGFHNVGQWLERAARNQLAADRQSVQVNRFRADRRDAERDHHKSMPYPSDYGLAADFDMPDHVPAPSPALAPFRR